MRAGWQIVVALACLVACGNGDSASRPAVPSDGAVGDALSDAVDADPCGMRPALPLCSASCGNNQIEDCYWIYSKNGLCYYQPQTERCDGELTPTCAELGLFGDLKPCSGCSVRVSMCEACAPDNVACAQVGSSVFRVDAVAASGARVGMIDNIGNVGPTPKIWVVEHLTKLAEAYQPHPRTSAIVGVPNGWLVAGTAPSALYTLDASGNLGSAQPIDTDEPALAYGPGQRVIVAWSELVMSAWHTYFELANETGQLVVPKTPLFAGGGQRPGVATDGTSFFVGARGALARIGAAGAQSITTGFPTFSETQLSWHESTGWYVARDPAGIYIAQRFDATGAPTGSPLAIGALVVDVLADGDDLLVLRSSPLPYAVSKLRLVRVAPTGAELAATDVGAQDRTARIVRAAGTLYVAWSWSSKTRIAQVAL